MFPDIPEKIVLGIVVSANCPPVPLSTLQEPVPTVGVLPVNVHAFNPHVVAHTIVPTSLPALAAGSGFTVTINASEAVQP